MRKVNGHPAAELTGIDCSRLVASSPCAARVFLRLKDLTFPLTKSLTLLCSRRAGIINDSTEFVCGPFEKYRRWRSVLNKLRTLFRAIKRVREQYAKLATQCWEERGLRIETSEGARMAPLSTLLVRTGKNQELKRVQYRRLFCL